MILFLSWYIYLHEPLHLDYNISRFNKKACTIAMICIQIIVSSFAISPCTLHICTNLYHSDFLGQILLNSSQIMLSLAYLYYFSLCIIPLDKSVHWIRSGAAYKLKLGLSVEYFTLFISYKYFLPTWFCFTSKAWDLMLIGKYSHILYDRAKRNLDLFFSFYFKVLLTPICTIQFLHHFTLNLLFFYLHLSALIYTFLFLVTIYLFLFHSSHFRFTIFSSRSFQTLISYLHSYLYIWFHSALLLVLCLLNYAICRYYYI